MSNVIKKPLSLVLALMILLGVGAGFPVISVTASASAAISSVNRTFEQYVAAHLEDFRTSIDVTPYMSQFGSVRSTNPTRALQEADALMDIISDAFMEVLMNNAQLFHVRASYEIGCSYYTLGNTVSDFSFFITGFTYTMTRSRYTTAKREFDRAAINALAYARNAESDFEKALLLHDFLVLNVVYDKDNLNSVLRTGEPSNPLAHTAYGALVSGLAVCDGYARAYMHLLRQVGIENRYAEGRMSGSAHIWNVINIDGSWYHVDVTANDPLLNNDFDMYGIINRRFFLVSDTELRRIGEHTNISSPVRATSTIYDRSAWFRNINSAIVKLGDFYYWIHANSPNPGTQNNQIRRRNVNTGATTTLHRFESVWYTTPTTARTLGFSNTSYSSLATYNGLLYFNTSTNLQSFDPATGSASVVFTPANLGGSGTRYIYGMTMSGRTITYTIKSRAAENDSFMTRNVPIATATAITLNITTRTLAPGSTVTLRTTLTPATSNDFIHWVSSDPSVATVNANGRVTAVSRGTATITAHSDSGRSASARITVR